jgi:electron transfer flavoprotein beta subunit
MDASPAGPRVLVCIKRVPAPGAKINIAEAGLEVDTTNLGFTMSPHEECAVEEAVRIVEATDGRATVLTLGPEAAVEQLRYALSLGVHDAILVQTETTQLDPQHTARLLTEAIRQREAVDGPFDLILFGNESADTGGYQVGVRVAHALDRPMVSGIKDLEPDFDAGTVRARREVEDGREIYQVPLPAAFGVREGLNLPRYPTMRGRLASKKVEVATVAAPALNEADRPGDQTRIGLGQPPVRVSNTVALGEGPAAAPAVVDLFDELGLLSPAVAEKRAVHDAEVRR